MLGNNNTKEGKINTITTQENNVETPNRRKNHKQLSKPTTRELSLCENYYNT
jgi:hypothetical protein